MGDESAVPSYLDLVRNQRELIAKLQEEITTSSFGNPGGVASLGQVLDGSITSLGELRALAVKDKRYPDTELPA